MRTHVLVREESFYPIPLTQGTACCQHGHFLHGTEHDSNNQLYRMLDFFSALNRSSFINYIYHESVPLGCESIQQG